ncbi:MAG: hypothetical protein P5693_26080, partial [Limnospira sp. PMC 1290.21]|uniref:hypothetical protein n=1 Tax=Limnospira sp. PMC 1290.21 TaxID=2981073 RepID=UPI0028E14E17
MRQNRGIFILTEYSRLTHHNSDRFPLPSPRRSLSPSLSQAIAFPFPLKGDRFPLPSQRRSLSPSLSKAIAFPFPL